MRQGRRAGCWAGWWAAACNRSRPRPRGAPDAPALQLSGAAKFPYLSLEAPSIDLGRVPVGSTATAQLRLGNHSPVEAAFTVAPDGGAADEGGEVFSVTPAQ
jgi:hypothetical protein